MEECCKGYTQTNVGDKCIPVCSEACVHGTCVAPDTCKCESGYGGPLCNVSEYRPTLIILFYTLYGELKIRRKKKKNCFSLAECPFGKYGKECKKSCRCANGASCDPYDGKCTCTRGWTGEFCNEMCPPNKYGLNCDEDCRCLNGGSCHHVSGECHCTPGFTGPL